jgi:ketosteroid isomerase-like protein
MLLITCLVVRGQSPSLSDPDREAIEATLMAQQAAWNRGDLDAFMRSYWQSDSLTFVGVRGVTDGWQATLDRYRLRYPDRATMGSLAFEVLRLDALGADAAMLIGSWRLTRATDSPGGHFTLIWRRIGGDWCIVSDHTSVEE